MKDSKKYKCFDSGAPIHLYECNYQHGLWTKIVHNHNYIEIAIIKNGVGIHKINDTNYTVKKGEVYIINTESIHCFTPCDDDNSQNLSILFIGFYPEYLYEMRLDPSLLNNIINMLLFKFCYVQNNKYSFDLNLEELESAQYLFNKMINELADYKSGNLDMLKMYLCILLIEFSRCYSKSIKTLPQINNNHFSIVKNIINYLSVHYSENISLTTLSEHFHISERHLSRIFKKATSLSVFEYLQKIRIEKACLLLKTTDKTVTDIVTTVGFTDYRYFSKIFKNYTGITPKKYAKNNEI